MTVKNRSFTVSAILPTFVNGDFRLMQGVGYLILLGFFMPLAVSGAGSQGFIPNKGQWDRQVLYKTELSSGNFFLEQTGFTYGFYDATALRDAHARTKLVLNPGRLRFHTVRMTFAACNPLAGITAQDAGSTRYSYFSGNDPARWAGGLRAYRQVVYENLYEGISLQVLYTQTGIKYEFHVEPGADPSLIRMKYNGADSLKITDERLNIYTSLHVITEEKPLAWQWLGEEKMPVECRFMFSEDEVYFQLGSIRSDLPLIIDPELIFSTYSGSTADNWGFTSAFDSRGNGYAGGIVFNPGFPSTPGAFDTLYNGGEISYIGRPIPGFDIGILKFSPDGSDLLYATYLGGNGNEFPHSIVVNRHDELYVFGVTSSSDFPHPEDAWEPQFKGGPSVQLTGGLAFSAGTDIYISRLSRDGDRLLSGTYIGGAGNDGANIADTLHYNYGDASRGSINIDGDGNVIVVSSTSSVDFPVKQAFQPQYGGGTQDGVVFTFNETLSNLLWSSYIGGDKADGVYGLAFGNNGNIVITGGTCSPGFPSTPAAVQTAYRGGPSDGFVSIIDPVTIQAVASSFIGSGSYDQSYLVDTDSEGNIYVFGQTESDSTDFIRNASFFTPGGNQFVTKFSPDLSQIVWSTAFGNATRKPDICPTALLVDLCHRIHLSGWGGTTNALISPVTGVNTVTTGLPVTDDALRRTSDGSDFYLMVMDGDAQGLLYGTFLGVNNPSAPLAGDHVDGGTSRFDRKGIIYQTACASCGGNNGFPTTPTAWSRTNRSWNCNNVLVKFDFHSPATIADFIPEISVGCLPLPVLFENRSINSRSYQWLIDNLPVGTGDSLEYIFEQAGSYRVTLIARNPSTCNGEDIFSKIVTISELPSPPDTLPDVTACPGDPVEMGLPASVFPGADFQWNPSAGISDPQRSDPVLTVSQSGIYSLAISRYNCSDTVKTRVTLKASPHAEPGYQLMAGCDGITASFANQGTGDQQLFWKFGNGETSTDPEPVVIFPYQALLNATLTATAGECTDTASVMEALNSIYEYYKENDSNVFSPNGDGVNDCFSPAFQPLPPGDVFLPCSDLVVYTRWGERVFDSTMQEVPACWDGTSFDGSALPEGVYFYRFIFDGTERAGIVHLRLY